MNHYPISRVYLCMLLLIAAQSAFAQKANVSGKNSINEFYYWVYSHPGIKQQAPKIGFDAVSAVERLPYLFPSGTQTKQFISYDAAGANTDGDFQHAFTKYIDSNGEHVIFDEYGPGSLYRQQMNIWYDFDQHRKLFPEAGSAKIRYYFDDEIKPRIDCTIDQLFKSDSSVFVAPFRFMDKASRFAIAYYPLNFKKRLKITVMPELSWADRWTTWYQYTYLTYPQQTPVQSWKENAAVSHKAIDQWNSKGKDPKDTAGMLTLNYDLAVKDGDSVTINLDKAGSISSLKMKLLPYNSQTLNNTKLKIYWDDQKEAAIDVPLGYFFGGGGKDFPLKNKPTDKDVDIPSYNLTTLLFGFSGKDHSFFSYWPMPFWKKARIVVVNRTGAPIDSLNCSIGFKPSQVYAYPPQQSGYFHAKRTLDTAWSSKPYAVAFQEKGRGHVVGLMFYSNNYDMDSDEFTYIDGSRTPQMHGDGTEDDHNQGWGGSAFQEPLWGGLINGFQGSYRIYMNDAYIFNKNIDIRYEYEKVSSFKNTKTDVMIYYYKSSSSDTLKLTDEMDIGNAKSEAAHNYHVKGQVWNKTITNYYDGYTKAIDYNKVVDNGRAFTGSSTFEVTINPANDGVRLRRRIYRTDNGVQTAWVYVNGKKVEKPWHIVTNPSAPKHQIYVIDKKTVIKPSDLQNQGWFDSDFEIPAAYTAGQKKIKVTIVPILK